MALVKSKVGQLLAGIVNDKDSTTLSEIYDTLIERAVQTTDGNLAAAARLLGTSRAQLVYHQRGKRPKPVR